MFYNIHIGEQILNLLTAYPDMQSFYPIQTFDLRHQVDYVSPKKIQLFEEYRKDPAIARIFFYYLDIEKLKRYEMEIKLVKIKLYKMTVVSSKDFRENKI